MLLQPTAWCSLKFNIHWSPVFVVTIQINTHETRRVHNNRFISQNVNSNMIWKKERGAARLTVLLLLNFVCFSELSADMKIKNETIYILKWTDSNKDSFLSMELGQRSFIENKCDFRNCFLAEKITLPLAITHFDAVLFYSTALRAEPSLPMPTQRKTEQKYVFVSTEPAARFPITSRYDNFFNWTWTYKLYSDIIIANIAIRNENGQVIGPKTDMNWIPIEAMKPLGYDVTRRLEKKTYAVAWLVENCKVLGPHEAFVTVLRKELAKYNHSVHILGGCRKDNEDVVPCYNEQECYDAIQSRYYFYLSFENAMSEDYVTNQLLIALNNFAVPVVFGGANYTRLKI